MTRILVALAAASAGLLHCAASDVVVATLPAHHDAGPGSHKCADDGDCHGDEFCARATCEDEFGRCEHPATYCDGTHAPTCGCDGITYWNDCLRRLRRVSAAAAHECFEGELACNGPGTCPTGASCARISPSPDTCLESPGTCWVLPPSCPAPVEGPRFSRCGDPGSCVDACTAIRSEQLHRPLPTTCL
jgi:hypothetical protein